MLSVVVLALRIAIRLFRIVILTIEDSAFRLGIWGLLLVMMKWTIAALVAWVRLVGALRVVICFRPRTVMWLYRHRVLLTERAISIRAILLEIRSRRQS